DKIRQCFFSVDTFEMESLFQYSDIGRTGNFFRSFIMDIQNRGHFVSVSGLKPSIRKLYIFGKLWINKAQAFLLSASDQIRTENFKIIYVNKVCIVTATSDRIL